MDLFYHVIGGAMYQVKKMPKGKYLYKRILVCTTHPWPSLKEDSSWFQNGIYVPHQSTFQKIIHNGEEKKA